MTRVALAVAAIALAGTAAACSSGAPRGGAAETQLTAATQAVDVANVRRLLASGADPNKVVDVAGNPQSAWYLALNQLRPSKPATAEIIVAMLGAGASSRAAWGTNGGRPKEGFWETFFSGHRVGGTYEESPLIIAMSNPVLSVVTAIVTAGFDPSDGPRALVEAVESNQVEIVHLLIDHGVEANATFSASSALGAAIASRNVALMTYLEDHGATESGR